MFLNMPEHPDAAQEDAIIGRVLEGNSEAFREIVDLYAPRVLSFCRAHMRSEEDARDAAQEVFIRAYKSLGSYRRGENFASWLFAIAANNVRTHAKLFSANRQKEELLRQRHIAEPPHDPAEEAELALQKSALRIAVQSLPDDLRKPVALYYFAGLSVHETAHALGIGEEAVKTRLFRARGRLRKILQDEEQPKRPTRGISL